MLAAVLDQAHRMIELQEVMLADAEAFGNQFPAYRENPMRETLQAVEGLAADPDCAQRFGEFQRLMVYGREVKYAACMGTLKQLAGKFREGV
jgi:hypothetical protein